MSEQEKSGDSSATRDHSTSLQSDHEGREDYDMDIDRMVNEGLGGGTVTLHNGLIEESTTDTMEQGLTQQE
ncbi:hypothetical protein ACFO9Q_05020 [Paenibacillus sp. GCM10023252]|uniref:hypothetical protein n=1 Tax=Paenibacillus sp. GCM10023252 TaxID=3252649 RepID=UPI0036151010